MMLGCTTAEDVAKAMKDNGVEVVDVRLHRFAGYVAAHLFSR